MKYSTFFFGICICIVFFQSCMIEKRVHRKGYHLNWVGQGSEKPKTLAYNVETSSRTEVTNIQTDSAVVCEIEQASAHPSQFQAQKTITLEKKDNVSTSALKTKTRKRTARFQIPFEQLSTPREKLANSEIEGDTEQTVVQRLNELAIFAVMLAIIGLFVGGGLGILTGAFAILFGAISLKQIRNHPEKYSGEGMAIAAIYIGLFGSILFSLLAGILLGKLISSYLI